MACSTHVWVDLDAEGICHRRDPTHLGDPAAMHDVRLHDVVNTVCEIPASIHISRALRLGKTFISCTSLWSLVTGKQNRATCRLDGAAHGANS